MSPAEADQGEEADRVERAERDQRIGRDPGAGDSTGSDLPLGTVFRSGNGSRSGQGRLLLGDPADGASNMAIDAAILECLEAASAGQPTLRFYSWETPTLSLGYFQTLRSRASHPDSLHAPLVRRASGGGAIVHDRELTYSLTIPDTLVMGAARDLYRQVHDAFREALRPWGIHPRRFAELETEGPAGEPFLCFQRRTDDDLVLQGYKVLGSAQRRGREGVLQHGSLLIAASVAAPQLPGIGDLIGHCPAIIDIRDAVIEKLADLVGVHWQAGELSGAERAAARRIRETQFGCTDWTEKR
jgi:lipoate-protein ligase A